MKAAWIILGAVALSFGQTAKKATAPATPDTWERSKECAAQAEKMMGAHDAEMLALGGKHSDGWSNHYSQKYGRCFVKALYLPTKDVVKGGPTTSTALFDAFERSDLASTAVGPTPERGCRSEQNPEACAEIARALWKSACSIDHQPTDCGRAEQFIEEHMKH